MATIYQKFPNIKDVEKKVKIFPISMQFVPVLVAGKFLFNNVSIPAFSGNSGEKYILDGVYLSASNGIDELTFSKSIIDFLTLNIVRNGNKHPVTLAPFPFANFTQAEQFAANFAVNATEENSESFNFVLNGELNQIAELVGTIPKINLVCNVYRVTESFQ